MICFVYDRSSLITMCLKKFSGHTEILKIFHDVRLEHYQKRKEWLERKPFAEASKATYQAKFIEEMIEGILVVGKLISINVLVELCVFIYVQ